MSRSGGAGILALCVLAAAWLLGSTALVILGFGLGLATLAASFWARLVTNGLTVERRPVEGPPVEGDPLLLEAQLDGRRRLASRVEWRDRLGTLGEADALVGPDGRARIRLESVPRGRHRLGPGRLRVTDPLGLTRVEILVDRESTVTVRPRVPQLDTLFTETGAWGEGGRRALVRRPSGLAGVLSNSRSSSSIRGTNGPREPIWSRTRVSAVPISMSSGVCLPASRSRQNCARTPLCWTA